VAEYPGRLRRAGGSNGALAGAQVSAFITLTPLFTLFFSDLLSMAWPDVFARPMLNLIGYLGAFVVVAGAMYSAIGHRLWGRWRKREVVVTLPRSGE
jgi:hypothetical protein